MWLYVAGESMPVLKNEGDSVLAATINRSAVCSKTLSISSDIIILAFLPTFSMFLFGAI